MNHGDGAVAHTALQIHAREAMGGKDAFGEDATSSSSTNSKDRGSFGGGFGSGWAKRLSLGAGLRASSAPGLRGSQQGGRSGRGPAGSVQKLTEGEVAAKELFRLDAETREAEVHLIRAKPRESTFK
jgi:hypothetical protein